MIIEFFYNVYFRCKILLRKRFTLFSEKLLKGHYCWCIHQHKFNIFFASTSTILRESGKQPGNERDDLYRVNRTPNQWSTLASTTYPLLNIHTYLTCRSVHGLEGFFLLRILSWCLDIFRRTARVWSMNLFVCLSISVSQIRIISASCLFS